MRISETDQTKMLLFWAWVTFRLETVYVVIGMIFWPIWNRSRPRTNLYLGRNTSISINSLFLTYLILTFFFSFFPVCLFVCLFSLNQAISQTSCLFIWIFADTKHLKFPCLAVFSKEWSFWRTSSRTYWMDSWVRRPKAKKTMAPGTTESSQHNNKYVYWLGRQQLSNLIPNFLK